MINRLQALEKFSLFGWIWNHKYFFLFLFFTLPVIISSISQAIDENNYSIPFTQLGMSVLNGDNSVYNDIQILKTDPSQLLGIKPEIGIYRHFIYYLHIAFYIWKFLGYLFLISAPFYVIYFIFKLINSSATLKNMIMSIILGVSFIFIINLLITIYGLVNGKINLTLQGTQFYQILQIIYLTMPFHGVISMLKYIISLFI